MAYIQEPRTPHSIPPNYFPPSPSLTHPPPYPSNGRRSGMSFRPTRRDLLLCLLTLSFAYLLFTPPATVDNGGAGGGYNAPPRNPSYTGTSGSRISDIAHLFSPSSPHRHSTPKCPPTRPVYAEKSYIDTVKPVSIKVGKNELPWGSMIGKVLPGGSGVVDDGEGAEEDEEDDELVEISTKLFAHSAGWTLFERLYLFNGSFYVVTDNKDEWPQLRLMTSTGLPSLPGNEAEREPTGDEIKFVSPREAYNLWGDRVYRMDGTTWLFQDGQFMDHYYHFAAELLLGAWRAHCAYDDSITPLGETKLSPPSRIWFMHQSESEWRDKPRFNPKLLYSLFPNVATLYPSDFADLKNITSTPTAPKAYLLPRALYADRSAAFRDHWTGNTQRTAASAYQVGQTSRWFWEPIRRQVLRYSGVTEEILNRNLEGYGAIDPADLVQYGDQLSGLEPLAPAGNYRPVVTYISRQHSRRRLTVESHTELVAALEESSVRNGFELVVVEAEKMTHEEQFALAARTTIMLGVHGNGLTHLLWMPATPRSAVIEMFYDGGFAHDYQWTAHALGIRHFAVQHDKYYTRPNEATLAYPEGFQGNSITVVGKVVAGIIEDRLALKI